MNCNHFNYLQYTFFLGHKLSKVDFFFYISYILAPPRVHFPDRLLLFLPDLFWAFIPSLRFSYRDSGRGSEARMARRSFSVAAGRLR